jgi:hypothetical protein
VTRRYAHLCPEGLARAVRETRPELQMNLLHRPQVAGAEFVGDREKGLILAEEKGFEPLVGLPPTAVLKTEWKRRRDGHLRRDGTILGPRARIA